MPTADTTTARRARRSVARGIPGALALGGLAYGIHVGLGDSPYVTGLGHWPLAAALRGLAWLVDWSEVEKAIVILASSWPVMSDSARRLFRGAGFAAPRPARRPSPAPVAHRWEAAR